MRLSGQEKAMFIGTDCVPETCYPADDVPLFIRLILIGRSMSFYRALQLYFSNWHKEILCGVQIAIPLTNILPVALAREVSRDKKRFKSERRLSCAADTLLHPVLRV